MLRTARKLGLIGSLYGSRKDIRIAAGCLKRDISFARSILERCGIQAGELLPLPDLVFLERLDQEENESARKALTLMLTLRCFQTNDDITYLTFQNSWRQFTTLINYYLEEAVEAASPLLRESREIWRELQIERKKDGGDAFGKKAPDGSRQDKDVLEERIRESLRQIESSEAARGSLQAGQASGKAERSIRSELTNRGMRKKAADKTAAAAARAARMPNYREIWKISTAPVRTQTAARLYSELERMDPESRKELLQILGVSPEKYPGNLRYITRRNWREMADRAEAALEDLSDRDRKLLRETRLKRQILQMAAKTRTASQLRLFLMLPSGENQEIENSSEEKSSIKLLEQLEHRIQQEGPDAPALPGEIQAVQERLSQIPDAGWLWIEKWLEQFDGAQQQETEPHDQRSWTKSYRDAVIRRREALRNWISHLEMDLWEELLHEIRRDGQRKSSADRADILVGEDGRDAGRDRKSESSASGTWPEAAREEKAGEGKDWLSRFIVETDLNLREGEASADREVLQYKESLLTFLEGEESFAALEELVHIAKRSGNERLRESVNQWLEPEEMYRRDVREKRNPATPAQNFLVRQFLEWKPLIQSVFQKDVEEEDGYAELKLYQRKEEGSVQEVQRTQRYLQEIILDMEKDGQTGENIQPERVFAPLFGNLAVEDTEPVFSYQPASLITARPAHQRYSSAAPSPPVLEEIQSKVASAVKEQTNDIKFVTKPPAFTTASEEYAKEIRQIRTSQERQHKEIEEIKQIQRSLLERTETGRMTETVMRQMQKQLKIEKLRRGM